jgi:hypothetical protein
MWNQVADRRFDGRLRVVQRRAGRQMTTAGETDLRALA